MSPDFFFYQTPVSHVKNSIFNVKPLNILYLFTPNIAHIIFERVYIFKLFFYSKAVYKHAFFWQGGGGCARVHDMTFLIVCILVDIYEIS